MGGYLDIRALAELEDYGCPVASTHEIAIDGDDPASLADWADVQHRLVLGLDGGCVR